MKKIIENSCKYICQECGFKRSNETQFRLTDKIKLEDNSYFTDVKERNFDGKLIWWIMKTNFGDFGQ